MRQALSNTVTTHGKNARAVKYPTTFTFWVARRITGRFDRSASGENHG
jgi:hypothetical protein